MAEEYDYLFKSIVVGDGGVGKTALTLRFSKGFFTEDYKMTIGVDFHVKTISIDTSEGPIKCKLQLWDTGGQERFSSIRPMYYRGSLGAVLVFDLTNYASFEHLPQWIEEVRANIKNEIPLLLVGNKSDLADQRAVSIEEINNFTKDFNLYYMETSAKTGDGVGDCFYILACFMIGSGVPEQLIANETVFSPGHITLKVGPVLTRSITPQEIDYAAPPVPEPSSVRPPETVHKFEPEPEIDYAAPPVPEPPSVSPPETMHKFEPEPEIDYAAPPVPEPTSIKPLEPTPKYEPEPEIKLPEPSEIEFKTPEEILAGESDITQPAFDKIIETAEPATYKPKGVPFSDSTPIPAPRPEGFPSIEKSTVKKKEAEAIPPFRVSKREEPPKPKPASMTFEQTTERSPIPKKESPIFPSSLTTSQESSSQSLVDYMPQTILSKKEKKKLAKEKKKKEKEKKLQEEREKQEELIASMKKLKKQKKEKPLEVSEPPSLFQTLTQRTEEIVEDKSTTVLPFVVTNEIESEETSKLRIIPNVADIEVEPSGFMPITPTSIEQQKETSKSQELLECKHCGAVLSADYAYCNKCGKKL